MAKELIKDMEKLLIKLGDDIPEIVSLVKNRQIRTKRRTGILSTNIQVIDKFMKAKQKIKITNLFQKIKKNTISSRQSNKSQQKSSKSNKLKKVTRRMILQQKIIRMLQHENKDLILNNKKLYYRLNSDGNENQIIRQRNEEFGFLAFEFLNDLESSNSNSNSVSVCSSDSRSQKLNGKTGLQEIKEEEQDDFQMDQNSLPISDDSDPFSNRQISKFM